MKPVFKLEGVTRTAVNLENYSKKEVCGKTRALHVSIKQSDEEDEKHYTYILSKINTDILSEIFIKCQTPVGVS